MHHRQGLATCRVPPITARNRYFSSPSSLLSIKVGILRERMQVTMVLFHLMQRKYTFVAYRACTPATVMQTRWFLLGNGPPLARWTPAEMRTMPTQSASLGHSPRSGIANSADSAGTKAPKAAPPEAPRMAMARPYRRRETIVQ